MERQLRSPVWAARSPDWPAAVAAGLAAGATLMVLELLWAASLGDIGPWAVSRMVAAIVLGPGVLQSPDFALGVVALALLIHYLLGVFSGGVIGALIAGFAVEPGLLAIQAFGALFGAIVYAANFHGLTTIFPWFADLRGVATLFGHLVFGITAALVYWKLRRSEGGKR